MGYYADGDGAISYKRELTDEEKDKVKDILYDAFEYVDIYRSDEVYISDGGKYYGDDVISALNRAADAVPVAVGSIEYHGVDGCNWRFVYKNGKWIEENGTLSYPSDYFGIVRWTTEDVEVALDQMGIEASDELIDDVETACRNNKYFTDTMIAAGWDMIHETIRECLRKDGKDA